MISLQNIHKAYGAQVIFDGASFQLNARDRVALVGPNGAGKSTLFKIILGAEETDDGDVAIRQDMRIGYLPQETAEFSDGTVLEEALKFSHGEASQQEDPHQIIDEKTTALAKKILMGLGFRVTDFDRPVTALSGGWRMRAAIARLLIMKPDVLLLDEPTNHLDLESMLWFQNYIREWRGALLLISHDRAFVNATVDAIVNLRERKLFKYPGDYENFLATRVMEDGQLVAAYKRQQKEIEDAEIFISRFRASAAKAPQVQSRIKMLDKLERIELPAELKQVKIRFPQPPRAGVRSLVLKNVKKSYGDVKVYDGLDFELERGQKMALVGHNGAGKSTLLKVLAGVIPIDGGERLPGLNVNVGYYSQHRIDMLNADRTVIDEAMNINRGHPDLFVRTVLGTFLFSGDTVYKKVGVLSGGEKSRLALVKLLLDPPNVMLLDEPTTHLDLASVQALIDALKDFEGTLCFISHDLFFINSLAEHIAHVETGKVTLYPGNYDYFQRRVSQKAEEAAAPVRAPSAPPREIAKAAAPPASSPHADLARFNESQKNRDKARKKIRREIEDLEADLAEMETQLGSVFIKSDYQKLMEIDAEIAAAKKELEAKKKQLEDPAA